MKGGLDLSKFKKVACDKGCSTLRHVDGHELRIAHKALSPQMRRDLDKLPIHAADGGDVQPASPDAPAPGGEEQSVSEVPGDFGAPAEPQAAPTQLAPEAAPDQGTPQSPEGGSAAEAPEEDSQPPPPPPPAPPQGVAALPPVLPTPQTMADEIRAHGQMYSQALAQGQIKPETYESLFAKKDTLGKIGTLFGLMVSGAGSGLARQPNAVMEMMQKEIQNDLTAQQNSKSNAENFLRLNQEYTFKNAEMRARAIESELTKGQIAMLPEQKKYMAAQRQLLQVQAAAQARTMAIQNENYSALHAITMNIQKYPPGSPQRRDAEQAAAILSTMVKSEDGFLADRAALAGAAAAGLIGAPEQGGANPEAAFQAQQRLRRMSGHGDMAKTAEEHRIPGFNGETSLPVDRASQDKIRDLVDYDNQLSRMIKWTQKYGGTTLDRPRVDEGKVMAADLQSAYRNATNGGVYKPGEQNFIEKIIPENPASFAGKTFGTTLSKLRQVQKNARFQMDNHLKSFGLTGISAQRKAPAPAEGAKAWDKMGNPLTRKNGAWRRD